MKDVKRVVNNNVTKELLSPTKDVSNNNLKTGIQLENIVQSKFFISWVIKFKVGFLFAKETSFLFGFVLTVLWYYIIYI